jgi:hypothetical protein
VTTALVREVERMRVELRALTAQRSAPSDPIRLARLVGIEPDAWQCELLLSEARQLIMLASRQSGKSTVSALLALYTALFRAPSLVLLLAPALRQSQELFRKVRDTLAVLDAPFAPVVEESALRVEFANGSRIISLPGREQTVRGFSAVALLVVDEAARVDDALYHAIRPMVAVSRGRVVLLSTPYGARGFFHREWGEGGPDWHRFRVTAAEVPRILADWLEAERRAIGELAYRQEYGVEFVDVEDAVFSSDDIHAALVDDLPPLLAGAWP